ncbi:MAG TPA: hypothetical protein VHB77_02405 [Planctomycetaceae bacterium]|nr:hypothetical protein [Planctomycetaceae bacterium]
MWLNAHGDYLIKEFLSPTPAFPSLFMLDEFRDFVRRRTAQSNGAILSVDVVHLRGMTLARSIIKQPRGSAMEYIGTILVPYRDFCYLVHAHATEFQGIVQRDSYANEVLAQEFAGRQRPRWSQDPYDPRFQAPLLWCQSDDERWDAATPNHALSRLRAALAKILPTIEVTREVKNSVPFRGAGA